VIAAINAKVQAQQIAVQKQNELVQSQADAAKLGSRGRRPSQSASRHRQWRSGIKPPARRGPSARTSSNGSSSPSPTAGSQNGTGQMPSVQAGGNIPGLLLDIKPPKVSCVEPAQATLSSIMHKKKRILDQLWIVCACVLTLGCCAFAIFAQGNHRRRRRSFEPKDSYRRRAACLYRKRKDSYSRRAHQMSAREMYF